jgi:hypothetical protein
MMRRLFVVLAAGVLVCAVAATAAYALTNNTVKYGVTLKSKGKPKKGKAVPTSYRGVLDVATDNGTQPNVAPTTKIYFAKQLVQNAKYFPKCDPKKLDGQTTVPASCKKAVVGKGTATASGGAPGGAINPATTESLTVTAYNGLKGKQLLLAVNGSSPLVISNRVIVGTLGKGSGPYGYTITFAVPADLQFQLGLQVALTHFDVTTSAKTITAKIKGKKKKVSYLSLASCPKSHKLPVKTVVNFDQDGAPGGPGTPGGQVGTFTGSFKC